MNQTKEFPLARGYLDRARKAKIQVNLLTLTAQIFRYREAGIA